MVPAEAELWQPNWGSQTDQEQPVKKNKQTKQREAETEIAREQKAEMKNTGCKGPKRRTCRLWLAEEVQRTLRSSELKSVSL